MHSRETARGYAAVMATAAIMSRGGWAGTPTAVRAVAGGGWTPETWQAELRRAHRSRAPLAAVSLRARPIEPEAPDRAWAALSRRLVDMLAISDCPWVAVRTGPNGITIVAATDQPIDRITLSEFAATHSPASSIGHERDLKVDPWLADGNATARAGTTSSVDRSLGLPEVPGRLRPAGNGEWEHAYRLAYKAAYTSVASGTLLAARTASDRLDESTDPAGQRRAALGALADVAAKIRELVQPHAGSPVNGPVDAEVAAGSRSNDPGEASLRGAVDGALDGARQIVTGWRAASPFRDRIAVLGEGTVTDWVHSTLATINRGVVRPWLAGEGPGPAVIARLGFVQAPTAAVESTATTTGPADTASRRSVTRRART